MARVFLFVAELAILTPGAGGACLARRRRLAAGFRDQRFATAAIGLCGASHFRCGGAACLIASPVYSRRLCASVGLLSSVYARTVVHEGDALSILVALDGFFSDAHQARRHSLG